MTDAALVRKVESLNARYCQWEKKCSEDWRNTYAQQERAEKALDKVSTQLSDLIQTITEEQYERSGLVSHLCCDWIDWQ